VTLLGGWAFAAGLGVLAAVGVWELGRMLATRGDRFLFAPAMGVAAVLPGAALSVSGGGMWVGTALIVGMLTGIATLRIPPAERPFQAAALSLAAALYVGGLLSFGVPLRESFVVGALEGTLFFFLPVAVTWLADTAAYLGGRKLGRRKLAPTVSPNKTVEGLAFGIAAGPVGTVIYAAALLPDVAARLGTSWLVALGFLIAAAATVGDLVESAIKRECGVKDSSGLLPGHGGLLDRMDSLLWSIPAAFLFLRLFV